MPGVDRRNVEMLREAYEHQVTELAERQRRLSEVSATAVSPRRELSVTVGPQGVITELKFLTSAYRRLAKNELSELVTRTIADARAKLTEELAEVMAPMMPPGMDVKAVLNGTVSAEQMAPDESKLPTLLRERLNRG
ncbi:YbaB/EbfC DNA-binding family protein [Saccharopolyspora antimicrobica]|uniref:YbaB/EbfC DNA-binding family protein n=1 Tax=Saccharopolyspora antimicrobica TaxID=455193 RepID=A0A1I5B350_9PSEU|nr:YbaB/EbfC family nucleoid-associated protein [Saccharopolyspora antimicrobica]RKT86453.1 YbaB/EbfC DNA-binding family protein [Saccharopolyspora antimicrobica]SFN69148.1 YbaB/EbfC DNA-binding family protein [Saccharopolyspora antimicrobica]